MLQFCLASIVGCLYVWKTFTGLSASAGLLVTKTRKSQAARSRNWNDLSRTEVRQENEANLINVL